MNSDFPSVETIEKEAISGLSFPHDDVLTDTTDQLQRRHDAERASKLGNSYQGKVTIYFQTHDGTTKRVQTTIWAVHEEYLTLKAGVTLPLHAIVRFDFQ
ncbi:hypothetical protein SAMN00120144_1693 [Hymenobacter roseosalivarius DSM 11622]|uniref:Uncharacterized protein n=1 Tax=Hymenobacter roseosalivarius DSM 11622 TaxID=645990 RepID=A0A1W1W429_9BACT|nr:hypothetical protein [Hymenobacter roseosalivarius]SMC00263.1 hypothetical protein SAMN00120144_1693 [Hymenobacter roseosalivarius DSM 11622]